MSLPELPCEIWAEAERYHVRQCLELEDIGIPDQFCEDCEACRRISLIADMAVADGHPKKRLAAMMTAMESWDVLDRRVKLHRHLHKQSQPKTCTEKVAMEAKRAYAAAHCTALSQGKTCKHPIRTWQNRGEDGWSWRQCCQELCVFCRHIF